MKIFHLADLHIGLKLMNHDLRDDQVYIFNQIVKHAKKEQPQVILIAGDIYDKSIPSAEAVETFDYFLNELYKAVPETIIMAISGNHDNASRVNIYRNILAQRNLHMIGNPPTKENEYIEKIKVADEFGDVNFYLLPFVKPVIIKDIVGTQENGNLLSYDESIRKLINRENVDETERNVFVSHQFYLPSGTKAEDVERAESEIKSVGNIDEVSGEVLKVFDYAALGHIHKPMKVGSEFYRYSGTPLACSISEAGQQKGIIMVELKEKDNVSTSVIPLMPKRQVRIIKDKYEKVLEQASEDYVSILLTDKEELNIIDMQERLRAAFPNLLEIRRENLRKYNFNQNISEEHEMDPFELCCDFAEFTEEEKALLQDVINTVRGTI